MRRIAMPRSAAGAVATVAALCTLGVPAVASADPPPPASTTEFPVPVRSVSWCSLFVSPCWVLPVTTVVPSVTTDNPGEATFAATISTPVYTCPEVSVRWLNLTTGATGTALLRRVPLDYSRPIDAGEWCRYTPATAVTGSGTLAATADVGSVVTPGSVQIQINPAFGTVHVP